MAAPGKTPRQVAPKTNIKKGPIRSREAVPQQFKHKSSHNGDRKVQRVDFQAIPNDWQIFLKKVPKRRVPPGGQNDNNKWK